MERVIHRRAHPATDLSVAGLHPLLARIYAARGVASSEELALGLDQLLPPTTLHRAEEAGQLLADAVMQQSRILVVGDYDADGATSTALALASLRAMGAEHALRRARRGHGGRRP